MKIERINICEYNLQMLEPLWSIENFPEYIYRNDTQ
jgi:hypothetical protein